MTWWGISPNVAQKLTEALFGRESCFITQITASGCPPHSGLTHLFLASRFQTQPPAVRLAVPEEVHVHVGGGVRRGESVWHAPQAQQHGQHGIEPERTAGPCGGACWGRAVHLPPAPCHRASGQQGSGHSPDGNLGFEEFSRSVHTLRSAYPYDWGVFATLDFSAFKSMNFFCL